MNAPESTSAANDIDNTTTPPPHPRAHRQSQGQHQSRLSWSQSFLLAAPETGQNDNSRSSLLWSATQEKDSQHSDVLTQNALDFTNTQTQLGSSCDELSPLPPYSPTQQRQLPWGRLLPQGETSEPSGRDLLPTSPPDKKERNQGITYLGLEHIAPSDFFNVVVLGRSHKADLVVTAPTVEKTNDTQNFYDWAHGMISNQHCRIYCCLASSSASTAAASSSSSNNFPGTNAPPPAMEVYVEDTSGNGTIINQTTVLKRGQRRLLHSGDEVCLVSPVTLRKKIRSQHVLQQVLRQFSFVFVNLQQQQPQQSGFLWQPAPKRLCPPPTTTTTTNSNPPLFSSVTAAVGQKPNYQRKTAVDIHGLQSLGHPQPAQPNPSNPSNNNMGPPQRPTQQQRRVEEVYDLRDVLGSGTVGQVRRAIHRQTGQPVAVKTITLGRQRALGEAAAATMVEAEAAVLRDLSHPYIVKLLDVFVSPTAVHLVMELVHGGDLLDRILAKGRYTELESRRVMRRLLSAVHYLHQECNVVHRDLKPENILCVSTDNHVDVKLTDFGLAKALNGDDGLKTFCGTPQYFAPEVLRRQHTVAGQGRYGKAADMWSLGVILYVLLSGIPPFDASEGLDGVDKAVITFPEEFFAGVSEEAKDLVRRLLVADPRQRLDVRGACENGWILTEDGDTHVHPLDDPRLSATHRRLAFPPTSKDQSTADPPAKAAALPNEAQAKPSAKDDVGASRMDIDTKVDEPLTADSRNPLMDGTTTEMRPPLSPVVLNKKKRKSSELEKASLACSEEDSTVKDTTNPDPTHHVASSVRWTDRTEPPKETVSELAEPTAKGKVKVSLDEEKQPAADDDPASTAVTPGSSILQKKSPQSKTTDSDELSDDEIRSEFSDDRTESISTFSSDEHLETKGVAAGVDGDLFPREGTLAASKGDDPVAAQTKRRRVTDAADKKPAKRKTAAKAKGGKSKAATTKAAGGDAKAQKARSGGKQTTLSSWFKKSS